MLARMPHIGERVSFVVLGVTVLGVVTWVDGGMIELRDDTFTFHRVAARINDGWNPAVTIVRELPLSRYRVSGVGKPHKSDGPTLHITLEVEATSAQAAITMVARDYELHSPSAIEVVS